MTGDESHRRDPLEPASAPPEPLDLFHRWFEEARRTGAPDVDAMALATADPQGLPSVRMALARGIDPRGFVFFTNLESRKGLELAANPHAAALFYWPTTHRQVRLEGPVARVDDAESDAYFRSRPVGSRLSAIVSPQSRVIGSREKLEQQLEALALTHRHGSIPRPLHWGGLRLAPEVYEFWQSREHRLHDRLRYRRRPDGGWDIDRLAP